jgi:preprotein translocase subunit SecE
LADKNLDKEKNEVVKIDKEKEKKLNEKNSKRAESMKSPKKSPLKWFKEARAEFKKVTWPTPKQTAKNTWIVLVMLTIAGICIWGLDQGMEWVFNLILVRG